MRKLQVLMALTLAGVGLATAAELPVRKVVLYKHGVGFFERGGAVPSGESVQLGFKPSEMDDVLKSLTVVSQGRAVSGVRYESNEPIEKKLEDFPFRLGEAQPLSRILDQFKGSRLKLDLPRGEVEGAIISARTMPAGEERPEKHELILLLDSGELQTVDPAAASSLRFTDPRIQQQFKDYLLLIASARNRERRTVTIEAGGSGSQPMVARYVVPTPVWKSSYRLVFDQQEQPLLEGWAIVDNTTGEDWSNVSLSLVSGKPVSFITQLYEPKYVSRPYAELASDGAQRPIVHGAVVEADTAQERFRGNRQALAKSRIMGGIAGAPPAAPMAEMAMADELRHDVPSTVASLATGEELGDLFEYRLDKPVSIGRGESAMLPFLQQRIRGRKLLIYNEQHGSQHPLNAVELTNSSGTTLDGGAVTIFDAGAYAGEALFETIKGGDERLISYAVDLGTRITTAFDSSNRMLSEFTLRRGILTTRRAIREIRTYTIHNVDAKPKTVVIERAARGGYQPVEPQPSEKTANALRYEVQVAAGATQKFPVTEEYVADESFAITNLTYDQLVSYTRNKQLHAAGRAKLEQLAELKRQIADADREIEGIEQQVKEMFEDQERLRRNIASLRSVPGQDEQVQTYAKQLSEQERALASMRDRQAQLRKQRDQLQTQLNTMIETLEI